MIIDYIHPGTTAHTNQNATNVAGANIVKAANNKSDYDIGGASFTTAYKFIHIVSSDFAYPPLKAKKHSGNKAAGETELGVFDAVTTGVAGPEGTLTVGMEIHGGGFGNTFGPTATVTSISGYTGNTDNLLSNITSSIPLVQELINDTRLYFGTLTGKHIASFCIPPGEEIIFEKKPLQKVFATPGILPSSGMDNTTTTGIVFTKVR